MMEKRLSKPLRCVRNVKAKKLGFDHFQFHEQEPAVHLHPILAGVGGNAWQAAVSGTANPRAWNATR
ncbi:hypothetical protein JYU02_00955 [bacterium AH-315-P15]|nr:hypothetical protein [bacterium AH-315-P15]